MVSPASAALVSTTLALISAPALSVEKALPLLLQGQPAWRIAQHCLVGEWPAQEQHNHVQLVRQHDTQAVPICPQGNA